jgi:hypothetical protein
MSALLTAVVRLQVILTVRDPAKWYSSVAATIWYMDKVRMCTGAAMTRFNLRTHRYVPNFERSQLWMVAGMADMAMM